MLGFRSAARLLMLVLPLLLHGCGGVSLRATPAPAELAPLPPAALGSARQTRQIVHAAFGERELVLQCVLVVDGERLTVTGLDPLGQRLFHVTYDGLQVVVEQSPLLPVPLPAERLLVDLQLVYWPLDAWRTALTGSDWTIGEPVAGTRRLYRQGRLVAEVHRSTADPWAGRVWLSNFRDGYSLSVESQALP